MAKGQGDTARESARQVVEEQRQRRARKQGFIAAGGAVALVAVTIAIMVIVKVTGAGDTGQPVPTGSAAANVISLVTTIPPATLDAVGKGKVAGKPVAIKDIPPLTVGDKPLVLYVGAEFCPFCASQRWAVVIALSRFGTFSNLGLSHSASDDVFPNTQTPTFHGSTYTSDHLVFQGVETAKNVRKGNGYEPLESLNAQQAQVMQVLNAPPYVPEGGGSIPFMAMGNQYIFAGGGFSPELLAGLSATEIAKKILDPSTAVSKGAIGMANALTTAICGLTKGQPSAVCTSPAAQAYAGSL